MTEDQKTIGLESYEDVQEAVFAMLEHNDCIVSVVKHTEPMMEGWSARIETIGAPTGIDGDASFTSEDLALRTLHGVRRTASRGRCVRGGLILVWQGEVENPTGGFEKGVFQIWIGRGDQLPEDVSYAFGHEHDKLVGEAVLERMAEDVVLLNAADAQAVMSTPHSYERLTEIRRVLDVLDGSVRN